MKKSMPTTRMKVTTIRLEQRLLEEYKKLEDPERGYQALMREVLWNYLSSVSNVYRKPIQEKDILSYYEATSNSQQVCAITGETIYIGELYLIGKTRTCDVPLKGDLFSQRVSLF